MPTTVAMPEVLRAGRVCLRCWQPADAAALKDALDESLPELQMWVPWALGEPSPIDTLEERLADMRRAFLAGEDWVFGIFDAAETRVLGGAGLHPRRAGRLEIGYWIRTADAGRGLGTEAARALCAAAFAHTRVARVEIRCDANNRRSAAIPRRLGFTLARTEREAVETLQGAHRDTLVWTLRRSQHAAEIRA